MKPLSMPKLLSLGLMFVYGLALAPDLQAAITVVVPNGNFLSPTVSNPPGYQANLVPDGWNYSGDAQKGMQIPGPGEQEFYYGTTWLEGQAGAPTGTLQLLNLGTAVHAIGDVYTLTFVSGSGNNGPATLTADLLVDGNAVANKVVTYTAPLSRAQYSLEWTANATGALGIRFNYVPTDYGSAQVTLSAVGLSYDAPVPEPSAMALLATGLLGLLWRAPGGKRRSTALG